MTMYYDIIFCFMNVSLFEEIYFMHVK